HDSSPFTRVTADVSCTSRALAMERHRFTERSASSHTPEERAEVRKHHHTHSLRRRFEVLKTLGRGTYGKVKRAVERRCGKTVAIKSIRKERLRDDLDRAHIQREIEITASLVHPNIIPSLSFRNLSNMGRLLFLLFLEKILRCDILINIT
uniref:non-specific serine/threonine protein kinase n=1 Tax=Cyprinus carpio carpio TaxID=630221 RepID=A0A8C0YF34_CYPCA